MIESKLSGESKNILEENIFKLKKLFPEILSEDKIDFKKLKIILTNEITDSKERYNFSWNGKNEAMAESQKPSTGTLIPAKEESKDWNRTKNLYIEGDNLEVLKLLQKSYYGKIKMIYIDPPYNTGKDFIYQDNYKDNLENYLEISGQAVREDPSQDDKSPKLKKLSTNSESNGRYHTNWLNMMYPRIKLARNLLTDDGVIFISIDDNEIENLKKVCNEIFGEDNFISQIIIRSNPGGRDYGGVAITHEYLLCYSKSESIELSMVFDDKKEFKYKDNFGGFDDRELRNRNIRFHIGNRPNLCYPFFVNINEIDENGLYPVSLENEEGFIEVMPLKSQGVQTVWRWGKEKSKENLNTNLAGKMKKDGTFMIVEKYRNPYKRERSIWDEKNLRNEAGSLEIKKLFNNKPFDYPKSLELINRIINLGSNKDSLILDFFSGSGTTAHSVMNLNINDKGNRKFIMIQLPEPTDEKSEAFKAGYKTIAEIGKERIRRAGNKIKSESNNKNLDVGFKVFKLDSSNLKKWDPDYENPEQSVLTSVNNIKEDRTEFNLLYEIMLKYGIDLSLPIKEYDINSKKIYSIGFGALLICLDDEITSEIANEIIKLKEELSPETNRVVVKDNGFKSDSDKTNIKETLKTNGIDEFITI